MTSNESLVASADLQMVRRDLVSFLEIMRREDAAEGGSSYFKPEFAEALKMFLQDPNSETAVRLLDEAPILEQFFEACSPGGQNYEMDKLLDRRLEHLRFVGEDGFYPSWVKDSGRWVFQRTLVSVGDDSNYAELASQRVRVADQVIVWVPPARQARSQDFENERAEALRQLNTFALRCYGEDCALSAEVKELTDIVRIAWDVAETPEGWLLLCPACEGPVGPDLATVVGPVVLRRWQQQGRPALDNPAASAMFKSAPPVTDLDDWIAKNEPSHLEIAYLAQQLWPDIGSMMRALRIAV